MCEWAGLRQHETMMRSNVIRFTKMHGIGNDYVYINAFEQRIDDPAALAEEMSDRHFGVGSDGVILIMPPESGVEADVRMRMFNADGSESVMCGNGVRCVCKFAHDRGISAAQPMRIQTGGGVLSLDYTLDDRSKVSEVTVDMGEPITDLERVPVLKEKVSLVDDENPSAMYRFSAHDVEFNAVFVSMGNPHAVIYARDLGAINLHAVGPVLERHEAFPERMNVHFVHVHGPNEISMRTWERGSGITLACGSGACAACVAGVLAGMTDRQISAHLPGGELRLDWDESTGRVKMTGPAVEVFTGEWNE